MMVLYLASILVLIALQAALFAFVVSRTEPAAKTRARVRPLPPIRLPEGVSKTQKTASAQYVHEQPPNATIIDARTGERQRVRLPDIPLTD